jgi:restriction endonuclease S subunit
MPGSTMTAKNIPIKDCAEVLSGFSAKGAIVAKTDGTLQVLTAQHLNKGEPYRYQDDHKLLIHPPRSSEKYLLNPGDILFMSRGSNNYAVLLEDLSGPTIAPLTFFILKPKSIVFPAYLAWCLNQEMVRAKLNEIRTGAGTPMIPRQEFSEILIPLPGLSIQRKIVDLAALQLKEKELLKKLTEETDRLNRITGQHILSSLSKSKKE